MKPTSGNCSTIIQQALQLGILARPCRSTRVGAGEALEVSDTCFWIRNGADSSAPIWTPEPSDLVGDWELTTLDLIRQEWHKLTETPW